jgi:uncharacterized membrane protein
LSALMTIGMLPVLLIVLATTLELGAVRVIAARAQSAADLAAVVAVNDQDDDELAETGRLRLASGAADVARSVFADNLRTIEGTLAQSPAAIAANAAVTTDAIPATVRIVATIPVRTPLFGALFFHPVTDVAIRAAGGAR